MTGTAGLDGMGGMHGSTGGGSSMNFDQGREMVRPCPEVGSALRLMAANTQPAGVLDMLNACFVLGCTVSLVHCCCQTRWFRRQRLARKKVQP